MKKLLLLICFALLLAVDSFSQGAITPAVQPPGTTVKLSCVNGIKIDVSACDNCGTYDAYYNCSLRVTRGARFKMVKNPMDVRIRGNFVTVSSSVNGAYEKFSLGDIGMTQVNLEAFLTACSCSDDTPAPEYTYASYYYLSGVDTCYVTDYLKASVTIFSDTICVPLMDGTDTQVEAGTGSNIIVMGDGSLATPYTISMAAWIDTVTTLITISDLTAGIGEVLVSTGSGYEFITDSLFMRRYNDTLEVVEAASPQAAQTASTSAVGEEFWFRITGETGLTKMRKE